MPTERMTAAAYRATSKPSRNKFNARGEHYLGMWFPSQIELEHYRRCELRQAAREISGLKAHPKFWLEGMGCTYTADTEYCERGRTVITDVKGGKPTMTPLWRAKWRCAKKEYPCCEWRVVTRKDM